MTAVRQVRCYADPVSPYAWLALRALERLDTAGAHVTVVPVLFAGLLNAHGNLGPAEVEAKRRYLFRDVMREAARRGLPFAGPPGHPFNPLTALRMCTAVNDAAERRTLLVAFTGAAWERGDNLMDEATLVRLANDVGFDGAGRGRWRVRGADVPDRRRRRIVLGCGPGRCPALALAGQ